MNWEAWIGTALAISSAAILISFFIFICYDRGYKNGYHEGLDAKLKIDQKYKR